MEMRRLMVLLMAGVATLGVAGPVAAAPNVSNTSGSGETIYGEWSGEGTFGYVYLGEETGYGGFGDIYQETGEWVPCEASAPAPAPAPDKPIAQDTTPGEEFYGFVGTRSWGFASDVRIDITRKFDTARATGTIELYTQTVDECAGEYGDDPVAELGSIDVTVTGAGPIATFRGHGSYRMPSEFGGHENYRGRERAATGSVVAGGSIDTTFAGVHEPGHLVEPQQGLTPVRPACGSGRTARAAPCAGAARGRIAGRPDPTPRSGTASCRSGTWTRRTP